MSVGFAGYAAVFDRVDRAGDVVRRGAFAGSGAGSGALSGAGAEAVPLLWQHRGGAVGTIDTLAEDARGLRVSGRIDDPELAALVRSGAVAGLSVGYRPVTARQGAYRELTAVALVEISLVAVPMQPLARVDQVAA